MYHMKKIVFFILMVFCFPNLFAQSKNLVRYVDPMIGTQKMGHTFPGATVPFGAVQLSPDTDTIPYAVNGKYNPDVYKYCAGYQYGDSTIVGFSHTHFSGTGHSDLGDFLVMPTSGALRFPSRLPEVIAVDERGRDRCVGMQRHRAVAAVGRRDQAQASALVGGVGDPAVEDHADVDRRRRGGGAR